MDTAALSHLIVLALWVSILGCTLKPLELAGAAKNPEVTLPPLVQPNAPEDFQTKISPSPPYSLEGLAASSSTPEPAPLDYAAIRTAYEILGV
jgi:predicted small lipoprotein YifL